MLEATVYTVSVALFGFVIAGTARMRHDMLILACIPPMFVALIVGFSMAPDGTPLREIMGGDLEGDAL